MSLTEADRAELRRIRRKVDGIRGPGVVHTPDGVTINPPPSRGGAVASEHPVARFKITDNAPTDPATDDDADDNVMLASLWDGTNTGADDVPIRTNQSHDVDDEILCVWSDTGARSNDGTEITFADQLVGWEEVAGSPGLIPVNVTQSGGSDGNSTTAATYTYNATNAITGNSIDGGPFTVTCSRVRNGKATAATHGTGYFDSDGNFVLWWVDEKLSSNACT